MPYVACVDLSQRSSSAPLALLVASNCPVYISLVLMPSHEAHCHTHPWPFNVLFFVNYFFFDDEVSVHMEKGLMQKRTIGGLLTGLWQQAFHTSF